MKLGRQSMLGQGAFRLPAGLPSAALLILLSLPTFDAPAQTDPNTLAASARQAMAEQRFGDAAEIYAELASKFPNEPTLQANLGMALHFSDRDAEAIQPLREAAVAMPASFPAQFALGASLSRLGRHSEAVGPLRKAASANPRHAGAHALLAEALESTGDRAEAIPAWQALARLDASNPFAHAGMVRCYEDLAGLAIDQLRQSDPESPYMLRILGQTRLATGQYPSALYLFRAALERQPGVRAVHEALARVYEGAGKPEWAAIEREKTLALPLADCGPSPSAECNFADGKFDLAPPVGADSSSSDLFWAARSYASLAERSFERLAALPESVEKLTLVADILASQGQYSNAADAARRALEVGGRSGLMERRLAELLYLAGRTAEARPLLERFRRADPEDARWPAMLGNLLAQEQEYGQAIPLLLESLALTDTPDAVRLDLGRSHLALDQPEKALPHLQSSLDLDTDGSVHYQLAQAFQRLGMREQAREALTQYQALDARNRRQTEAGAALEVTAPD